MNKRTCKHFLTIAFGFIFAAFLQGCTQNMTYEEFLIRLQKDCPQYYLVRDFALEKQKMVCYCVLKETQEKYPNMESFLAGVEKYDRTPRGDSDLVPSAIRMAAGTCIKNTK